MADRPTSSDGGMRGEPARGADTPARRSVKVVGIVVLLKVIGIVVGIVALRALQVELGVGAALLVLAHGAVVALVAYKLRGRMRHRRRAQHEHPGRIEGPRKNRDSAASGPPPHGHARAHNNP